MVSRMMSIRLGRKDLRALTSTVASELRLLDAKIKKYETRLKDYEGRYKMKTALFLKKFESGELGDDEHWFHWYADADTLRVLREKQKALNKVYSSCTS